ncbi:MAG: EAL domain-containing protein [Oscillospiraceae bacterium]|nr:EAL domain-containing protein [Oscillospiraceae bacterium]
MIDRIHNELFGSLWQQVLSCFPEIGSFVYDKSDNSVYADKNAVSLLGLPETYTAAQVDDAARKAQSSDRQGFYVNITTIEDNDRYKACLVRLAENMLADASSSVLCSKSDLVKAVNSAPDGSLLAFLQIEAYADDSNFSVYKAVDTIKKLIPDAYIAEQGKRLYWLYVPHVEGDQIVFLKDLQAMVRNALSSEVGARTAELTFTAGISADGVSTSSRMNTAEFTLYEAVKSGRNSILKCAVEDYESRREDFDKIKRFTSLLDNNLFSYHFQPIVSAHTGNIVAYEALMRTEKDIGMYPMEILEMAAQCDRLYDVEKATMTNTMEAVSSHRDEFAEKKLFVNCISAHTLTDTDWAELENRYSDIMGRMVVELTEQTEITDEMLLNIKRRLQKAGIELAIDDYGTGYSNTSNLMRYSPDYVKIDQSLIHEINKKPKVQQLVSGIIEFVHSNGYAALAEGVENYDELCVMMKLGADLIQGFYTSRPMPYLIERIPENVREEIIRINAEFGSDISRYYKPAAGETVNLFRLMEERFTAIFVDVPEVTVEGESNTPVSVPIVVKDGIKTRITIKNVCISYEKTNSIVTIGDGSSLELCLEGMNKFVKRGIFVPETASFTMTGAGSLSIMSQSTSAYAIGADKESSHGSITLENVGKLVIESYGDSCVGIGSGRNDSNNVITIKGGDVRIACEGSLSVCLGTIYGNSRIVITDCGVSALTNSSNSVGIGSYEGDTDISLCNFRYDSNLSGTNICSMGAITGGRGKISISDGSISGINHGRNIRCIGTEGGAVDISITRTDVSYECGGSHVTGIGDKAGPANISVNSSKLRMLLLTGDGKGLCTEGGNISVTDTIQQMSISE